MPVKMSRAIGDAGTPIVVDLDIFPICRGDATTVSSMEKRSEALLVEGILDTVAKILLTVLGWVDFKLGVSLAAGSLLYYSGFE